MWVTMLSIKIHDYSSTLKEVDFRWTITCVTGLSPKIGKEESYFATTLKLAISLLNY